jgi:hypothetical protein
MDTDMVRLVLELPLREHLRRTLHRPPSTVADPRLAEAEADLLEGVIREVLAALDLTQDEHDRALRVAVAALRRAVGEDRDEDPRYDQIVPSAPSLTSRADGW